MGILPGFNNIKRSPLTTAPLLVLLLVGCPSPSSKPPDSDPPEPPESLGAAAPLLERLLETAERPEAPPQRVVEATIEGLALLENTPDQSLELRFLLRLAAARIELSEYSLSLNISQRAEELAIHLANERGQAEATLLHARALYFSSRFQDAIDVANQAFTLYRNLGDDRGCGAALWHRGASLANLGSPAEAIEDYLATVRFYEQAGYLEGVPRVHYSIAVRYFFLGRLETAAEIAQQSLDAGRRYNNGELETISIQLLGNIRREQGHPEQALDLLNQALDLEVRLERGPQNNAEILQNLGDTLTVLGRLDEAEAHHRQALSIFETIDNPIEIASELVSLSRIASLQGAPETAIQNLERALEVSAKTHSKSKRAEILHELSKNQAALGRYREALETFQAYEALERELVNEQSEQQLNALQTRLEVTQKEQQIERLRGEKELRGLQLERQRAQRVVLLVGFASLLTILLLLFNRYRLTSRQELMAEAVRQEKEASARLREIDQVKDEFLANTSHELRTPLYGMIGLIETLRDSGQVRAAGQPMLDTVLASGRGLARLVGDILDIAKLRHSGLELVLEPVELYSLSDVVLTLSRPRAKAQGITLRNAVDPNLPAAQADPVRVQQILHNLVGNAIKFTPAGEVEISAEACHGELQVRVRDTGIGISPEDQEQIFEPFTQVNTTTSREAGGTGLGLAVSRQLVELHGGRLWVESQPSVGSIFSFTLPTTDVAPTPSVALQDTLQPQEQVEPAPGPAEASNPEDGSHNILVVDDEPVVRLVLFHQLLAAGYQLKTAESGPEALEILEQETVDLVLLDVMMPRMSGYEVCRAIRQTRSREELPVVFLSAKQRTEDRVAGFNEGGNDYLAKPIAKGELLARVQAHLELLEMHRTQARENLVLRRLLPICSRCKKIRDDEGYWNEIDEYLHQYSDLEFSHSLCRDCAVQLYPEYLDPCP